MEKEELKKRKEREYPETVQARLLGYLQAEGVDIDHFVKLSTEEKQKEIDKVYQKQTKKLEIIKEISCFFD